jgi:hypothetical protein
MNNQYKAPSVGDEIDSICTRCREETIHRVVAMVEGRVHLVICTRCWSQHRYRPSPQAKAKAKEKRVSMPTKRQARIAVKAKVSHTSQVQEILQQWRNLRENAQDLQPLPYDQSGSYRVTQAIEHPAFGLGFVHKVISNTKMEVIFQREVKLLVMNRDRSPET